MLSPVSVLPKLCFVIVDWAHTTSAVVANHNKATSRNEILRCCLIGFSSIRAKAQSNVLRCGGFAHQRDLSPVATFGENLIRHNADQNHCSHHREVERTRNAEQIYEVAQHLEQRRAD